MMKTEQIQKVLKENHVKKQTMEQAITVLDSLDLMGSMLKFERLSGHGMTNCLYLFETTNGKYLLRLPGEGTSHIISRQHEKDVYKALRGSDISDKVLFISGETGIKISTYLEDAHTCDSSKPEEVRILIRLIKKLHGMNLSVPHEFNLFQEIEKYERELSGLSTDTLQGENAQEATEEKMVDLLKEKVARYPDFVKIREQIYSLRPLIEKGSGKKCLCHVDAVQDNCLIQNAGEAQAEAHLIDWEYAGMCDPYIDVAMFNLYAGVDKEQADFAIEAYLGDRDSKADRRLIYAYMAAAAYLWVLWSEIKRESGVDYTEYENRQYSLAKEFFTYAFEAK